MKKRILLIAVCLLIYPQAWGGSLRGKVIRAVDGDTIDVLIGNKTERVRIYGINAPERWEPRHKEATAFTKKMTLGKRVKLLARGRGKYGRLLAFVIVDDKSVGLELVKNGLARVYSNGFAPENARTYERYKKAQIHAMSGDFGIWAKRKKLVSSRGLRRRPW